jgi:PAS domain S-box-containing protein
VTDTLPDGSAYLGTTLAWRPAHRHVEELPADARLVILDAIACGAAQVAAVRSRCPAARVLAWAPRSEAVVWSAVAGCDEIAVGEESVAARVDEQRRLDAAARAEGVHRRDSATLVGLMHEMARKPELHELLRVAIVRLSGQFDIGRASVVLLRPAQDVAFVVMATDSGGLENVVVRLQDYPELLNVLKGDARPISEALANALMAGAPPTTLAQSHADHAAVLFPLVRKDEVVGALLLRGRSATAPGPARLLEVGQLIASITAVALGDALEHDMLLSTQRELLRRQDDVRQQLVNLRQFAEVFEQSFDGTLITNAEGMIRYANPAAGAILQRKPDRLNGYRFMDLLDSDTRVLADRAFRGDSVGDAYGYVDLAVSDEAGSHTLISAAIRPLADGGAVLITFRDVTEVRTVERELRQACEVWEAGTRTRDQRIQEQERALAHAAGVARGLAATVARLSGQVVAAAQRGAALDAEAVELISRESERSMALVAALDVAPE